MQPETWMAQYAQPNITVRARKVSVATSSTTLIEANPRRLVLFLSAPTANRVTVSCEDTAADLTGIVLYAATRAVVLTMDSHGVMVTRQWKAISVTASQDIGVVEVLRSE